MGFFIHNILKKSSIKCIITDTMCFRKYKRKERASRRKRKKTSMLPNPEEKDNVHMREKSLKYTNDDKKGEKIHSTNER